MMSIAEIKKCIIDRIKDVDDGAILDEVYKILQIPETSGDMYVFSEKQSQVIDSRLKEMDNGHFISHEQAERDLDAWL